MKRIFLLIALLCSLLVWGSAFAYTSPGTPSGYVNDFASVLNTDEKTTLEATLKDFHDKYGGEVSVVTIPTLGGDVIETYANTLFREWGIGEKDKNNGVLLVVAINDHKLRIEVGYGYEGVLTDARSSEIIRNSITPYFKQGAYGLGIASGVKDILAVLETGEVPLEHQDAATPVSNSQADINTWLFLAFVVFPWAASIFGRSKSWWAGGVVGAIAGGFVSTFVSTFSWLFIVLGFSVIGLLFDFIVSRGYQNSVSSGTRPPWWTGGGGFGGGSSSGGGFGGFGGGSSGGGGASGSW